ncbi:hypothetical protein [Mycobacterium kansasii]
MAGNAAFVVAPRALTRGIDLRRRVCRVVWQHH